MNAATSDCQALTLTVDPETTMAVAKYSTASTDNIRPRQAAEPIPGDGDFAHRVRRFAARTSRLGRRLDGALVIALLAPPALIAVLMVLGLQFALAVCVMFAVVFVITTSEDALWKWRRHTDREDQWNLD